MNQSPSFDHYPDVSIVGQVKERATFRQALEDSYRANEIQPIVWYGSPGYGKSALRQGLDELLQSVRLGDEEGLPKRIAYASLQLKDGQPVTDQLISIRTQLARSGGFRFFLFDWAFIRWFKLAHPDASIEQRHPNMFSAGGRGASDDILSWLDEIRKDKLGDAVAEHAGEFVQDSISLVPGLNLLVKYGSKLGASAKGWWDKKAYREQIARLDRLSEEELLEQLPGLLAADLQTVLLEVRRKQGAASATILIDGAEKLLTAHDHRGALDRWLLEFRKNAPAVFLNLFSRSEAPVPDMAAKRVGLRGIGDDDIRRLASPYDLPETCVQMIVRFACCVPLSARIALSLYQEHEGTLGSSDEEKAHALKMLLLTQGNARLLSHVARDMSSDTVRDMVFLSGLEHLTDPRVREYGDLVFGSSANVNLDSIINHGLLKSYELEEGTLLTVPEYLQQAFLRSPRHQRLNEDIQQRLSSACFELALRHAADGGELEGFVKTDMDTAVNFWTYRWNSLTFDHWESTMLSLMKGGHVQQVWTWAKLLLKRASQSGVIQLDDASTQGTLEFCAQVGLVVAKAAARFGDYTEALIYYQLVISAQRRLKQVDSSTCFKASELAIIAGDHEAFEEFVEAGLQNALTEIDHAMSILDHKCLSSEANTETYGHLLSTACDNEDILAFQGAHELAPTSRWLQCHSAIRAMHLRIEELLCIAEPNYRELRKLHSALSQARTIFCQGAWDLAALAPSFFAYETISESALTREVVILSSRSMQMELETGEHSNEVGKLAPLAEGWATLDDDLRGRVIAQAAYGLVEQCGEDLSTYGARLLRVLQIEADRGDFATMVNLCQGYEEELTRHDGGNASAPSYLILARVYGYFAVALYQLGEGEMVEGKLKFAMRAIIELTNEDPQSSHTRDELWLWFCESVCQPIGILPHIQKDEGGRWQYGLMPADEPHYH